MNELQKLYKAFNLIQKAKREILELEKAVIIDKNGNQKIVFIKK